MDKLRSAFILAFLTNSVLAGSAISAPLEPPAAYVHPYAGTLIEWHGDIPLIQQQHCRAWGLAPLACSSGTGIGIGDTCTIWLPRVGTSGPFRGGTITIDVALHEALRRHEIAHCNGWPPDHAVRSSPITGPELAKHP